MDGEEGLRLGALAERGRSWHVGFPRGCRAQWMLANALLSNCGVSGDEFIGWPVQQSCYAHSGVVHRFMHLLAPGESVANEKYPSFYQRLSEPVPSWEPRSALLHPCGHQLSAAQSLGKDPTDVRPPYGCFLIRDVFSNKLFK